MKIKNALKMIVLLMIGGTIYFCIEMLWRGHSHWTMALVGGICFIAIGAINEYIPWEMGMVQQSLIGACLVTGIEFIMGQICLPFFFAWIALSAVAIVVDDYLRYWLFKEEKPHYQLM